MAGWLLGNHIDRKAGTVCFNEKCGSRDAVTNLCPLNNGNRCRDLVVMKPDGLGGSKGGAAC
jgi:hypothetical protein